MKFNNNKNKVILLFLTFFNIILIINGSIIQFNNTINCKSIDSPCDWTDSNNWINNKLPSDGDDVLIDFESSIQDELNYGNIYLIGSNITVNLNSLILKGRRKGQDGSNDGFIILKLSNLNLTIVKLDTSNSIINFIDNSVVNVNDVLYIDSNSFLKFFNDSILSLNLNNENNESSIFKTSPLFESNSQLIITNNNSNGLSPPINSSTVFYNGVYINGSAVLSNSEFYKSSYFFGNVSINGMVELYSSSSEKNNYSKLSFNNDLQINDNGKIIINNGSMLSINGKINEKQLLDSSYNNLIILNGGDLEIVNSNNFTIYNFTNSINENEQQPYGSILFKIQDSNLEYNSNTIINLNNSNINIGTLRSKLTIINSTIHSLIEINEFGTKYNSIISASNVTLNSIQLNNTNLIIEEESTFILENKNNNKQIKSYSNSSIQTMGNFIIINSFLKVPFIDLINKMESSFYLINSELNGSLNVTDNKFFPNGKSTIKNNLYVDNGGEIIFDKSNSQLSIDGDLVLKPNSVLYIQDNNSTNNIIKIKGNITIIGKLIVNIKWTNKINSNTPYTLKLIEFQHGTQINGLFDDGIQILFNGNPQNQYNRLENYKIKIDESNIYLEIPDKKLPKWYIYLLVVGIICVIGVVAGLLYVIAGINRAVQYYTLKRKEENQKIILPLLNNTEKDNDIEMQINEKEKEKEDNINEQDETIPLNTSKNVTSIILTKDNN